MEKTDKKKFLTLMTYGSTLLDYAREGDLAGFKDVFEKSKEFGDLMYWHTQKAFKEAVKKKHLYILCFLVDELEMSLGDESFHGFLHSFIMEASKEETDELGLEVNRQIIRFLAKAAGKQGVDQMDRFTGSTALHAVCELFTDLVFVDAIVNAGADVNAVNNDGKLPLNLINEKLKLDPDSDVLFDIKELLERKGAKTDWRTNF